MLYYAPCKMFSESHVAGIQNFTNENREHFMSQIFGAINFRVKIFSDKRSRTTLALTMRILFHVFNFCIAHALTMKIS